MNENNRQARESHALATMAKPSEEGKAPQGIVSIERLSHFQCAACKGWWSIGDAPERVQWWCPWWVVLATVCRHLIALCRALDLVDPTLRQADLLTQPRNSERRRMYRERLKPDTPQQVAALLAVILGISVGEAIGWYDGLMIDGLDALIARSLVMLGLPPTISLEDARVQQRLNKQLRTLDDDSQRNIAEGVDHLRAASEDTGVPIPLAHLLSDRPYSDARQDFGRWLGFGMSAISRRGQQFKRKQMGNVKFRVGFHSSFMLD